MLKRINNIAYKLDFHCEYGVSSTFNVTDLSPFVFDEGLDSRTNQFKEGGVDETKAIKWEVKTQKRITAITLFLVNPFVNMVGQMTRKRSKRLKKALNQFIKNVSAQEEFKIHEIKPKVTTILMVEKKS